MNEKLSVLLVEDDWLIREDMAETLRDGGCEVQLAADYGEALLALEEEPRTAVLVTDIDFPGQRSGIELVADVRSRRPDIGVIVLSGKVRPPRGALPDDVLFCTKPCAPGALLELVRACRDWDSLGIRAEETSAATIS